MELGRPLQDPGHLVVVVDAGHVAGIGHGEGSGRADEGGGADEDRLLLQMNYK